jgi:hypothetical protein
LAEEELEEFLVELKLPIEEKLVHSLVDFLGEFVPGEIRVYA